MSHASQSRPEPDHKPIVYLVDDEVLLLDLAAMALQSQGYHLKRFQDPETAWQSFTRERVKPVLLLTDYAMGKMNGLELIERCKQTHPGLRTLLVSGTAGPEIVFQASVPVDRFLTKPYQPATLLEVVRELLA